MKNKVLVIMLAFLCFCVCACKEEKKSKDRTDADDMFARICKLTKEYTEKLEDIPDSSLWDATCAEFEERLEKISFSYPPDTDLLLTEGQNDTIHTLLVEYAKMRDDRIHEILHPHVEVDSVTGADSNVVVTVPEISNPKESEVILTSASRNPGN
ncbi:MAG: hypothetical protein K2L45_08855 [Muribaculaceae bacterium]|nr:hypothetical protein [Muribaculaceae bacterium]